MKILIVFSMLFVFFASCNDNKVQVSIDNNGPETILSGDIEIYGKKFSVDKIPPGGKKIVTFPVGPDDSFKVNIVFSDNSVAIEQGGYITSGIDYKYRVFIEGKKVQIENIEIMK